METMFMETPELRKSSRLIIKKEKAEWPKIYDIGAQAVYHNLAADPRYKRAMLHLYRVPERIPHFMEETITAVLEIKDREPGMSPIFMEKSARYTDLTWPELQYVDNNLYSEKAKILLDKTMNFTIKKRQYCAQFCEKCQFLRSDIGDCCKGNVRMKYPLMVLFVPGLGWTLRTLVNIPKNTFVGRYTGEIITSEEHANKERDDYAYELNGKLFITGEECGNEFRFLSHSCDPNLMSVWWAKMDSMGEILFQTMRDIQAGEELNIHYNDPQNEAERLACERTWPTCLCLSCFMRSKKSCLRAWS